MDNLEFTINDVDFNQKLYDAIFGVDLTDLPARYSISYLVMKQARTHRKRRINKKWAKRYGYVFVTKQIDGWEMVAHNDGRYEFIKEMRSSG